MTRNRHLTSARKLVQTSHLIRPPATFSPARRRAVPRSRRRELKAAGRIRGLGESLALPCKTEGTAGRTEGRLPSGSTLGTARPSDFARRLRRDKE